MKKVFLSFSVLAATALFAQEKDYAIRPVPFTNVKLNDKFWLPKIETNRTVTIPASFARCESTGRVENFIKAAKHSGSFGTKFPFDDTDIYKTLEGAAFSLAVHPDKRLEAYLDSMITIIGNAQEPDGYLYTPRTINPQKPHEWSGDRRWVLEHINSHELYNSGHLFEAAAAHYLSTGKRSLLNIALKNADLLVNTFGPGKLHVAPGHEIVEMGLVKLYRITGKKEYLDLAQFFIDERGKREYDKASKDVFKNGRYWQDATPVVKETEAVGHAVRAMYLYAAVADIAALKNDASYLSAIDTIWSNMVNSKIYVQGGIGAIGNGERFGENYELPNLTAYNETCAAVGNVYWNQRMFQLHGDAKYIDLLEHVLYNGLISGVALDGKSFFYTNAMEINRNHTHSESQRSGWFECSCCPTNLARFLPSLPGYVYAVKDNSVYVNMYISGSAAINFGKQAVNIVQQNNYPWDGNLMFTVNPKSTGNFNLMFRIPGWAQNRVLSSSQLYSFKTGENEEVRIKVNGKAVPYKSEKGYAILARKWQKGDKVEIVLPMQTRQVVADKRLGDDVGKIALQRGPLIYCAESIDNNGSINNFIVPQTVRLEPVFEENTLNGVMVLKGQTPKVVVKENKVETVISPFTAIPYYAWANRGEGEMRIWFPQEIKAVDLLTTP